MKNLLLTAFISSVAFFGYSQSVGVGTNTPNSNAALEVQSPKHNQGILIPRMTSAELSTMKASLGMAEKGMLVYDTTLNKLMNWNGTDWFIVGFIDDDWKIDSNGHVISKTGARVGINKTTPDAPLHVGGSAIVDDKSFATEFRFINPVTKIMSVAACAFNVARQQSAVKTSENAGLVSLTSGPNNSGLAAPLNLPNNAEITKVEIYIANNSTVNMTALMSQGTPGVGESSLSVTAPAGKTGWFELQPTGNPGSLTYPVTVNNMNSNYYLFVAYVGGPSVDGKIHGARITYTVERP